MADEALRFRLLRRELDVVVLKQTDERVVVCLRTDRVIGKRLTAPVAYAFVFKFNALHIPGTNLPQEFGVIGLLRWWTTDTAQALHDRQEHHDDDNENKDIFS